MIWRKKISMRVNFIFFHRGAMPWIIKFVKVMWKLRKFSHKFWQKFRETTKMEVNKELISRYIFFGGDESELSNLSNEQDFSWK